jgi:hypothetical protein
MPGGAPAYGTPARCLPPYPPFCRPKGGGGRWRPGVALDPFGSVEAIGVDNDITAREIWKYRDGRVYYAEWQGDLDGSWETWEIPSKFWTDSRNGEVIRRAIQLAETFVTLGKGKRVSPRPWK